MKSFPAGWYVIYTMPRHEKKVYTRLSELNINTYLPTKKVLRTWHDRRKYSDEPLFASYVFVHLESMQEYYDGLDTRGVLYYVRTGKEIARVQDSVVDNIKVVAGQGCDVELSERRFCPGKRLVISQGPLTGLSCELVEIDGKQRGLIRVDLLQRSLLLSLPVEHLMEAQ